MTVKGEADGVVLANDEAAFSGEAAVRTGDVEGVVLAAGLAGAKGDFTGVVVCATGDADVVPPKTAEPAPLPKVASPPVFHAGTESDLFDAAWLNADGPPEANAPNPPPPEVAGVPCFASAGFALLNVASPPDANALNPPPPPNVEGDVVLMGVTMGVVDMGVPGPALPNPDWPNDG